MGFRRRTPQKLIKTLLFTSYYPARWTPLVM
ncbi:rCG30507, partial [Rattus norvegicus]